MRRITIITAVIIIIFISSPAAFALEDIGYSKLHPASAIYFLKTIRENLEFKFALTPRVKMLRQLEFATRRLREAKTLVGISQELIPPTLERYSAHLNNLPDQNLTDEELFTRIQESLNIHLEVLLQIYSGANPRAKMAIRSAMNRIIRRNDVSASAKRPVCNFFSKEASASSLNQTEQSVLSTRADKCFDSLGVSSF